MKLNNLSIKKRLIPYLQLRSHWEQKYIKQLVKSFFRHKKNNPVIIIDAIKYLTSFKWVKKCFRRIKEGWKEEAVKGFGTFTAHSTSNKILCSIRNKDGARIKTQTMFSFWRHTWLRLNESYLWWKPPPSAIDEQSHDTEKVDPPGLSYKKILIEERLENYH